MYVCHSASIKPRSKPPPSPTHFLVTTAIEPTAEANHSCVSCSYSSYPCSNADTSATTISAGHELDKKVQQKAQIRRQAHVVPVVVDHLCDAPHERVELLLVRGNLREKGASVSLGLNRDPGRRHTSNAITSAQCAKRRNIATERQRACEATHKHCEQHAHYLELLHCALVKHLGAARVGGWAGGGRLGRASSGCGLLLLSSTLVATTTCRLLRVVLQQVLATC